MVKQSILRLAFLKWIVVTLFVFIFLSGKSQGLGRIIPAENSSVDKMDSIILQDGERISLQKLPLFSLLLDQKPVSSRDFLIRSVSDSLTVLSDSVLSIEIRKDTAKKNASYFRFRFINLSSKIVSVENLVPFGISADHPYITASGDKSWPGYLCRSKLFRPGFQPLGVLLPDNAWHLGWSDIKAGENLRISAVCRRTSKLNCQTDRWAATLEPGGWVEYSIYYVSHSGTWEQGLESIFRKHYLFDLQSFDSTMYQRDDLSWVRHSYLMLLRFAWDKDWYDPIIQKSTFYTDLTKYDQLTGGWDIFTIWPTWPKLGLDNRNQFDLYRDLPGGIPELKHQSAFMHSLGKKYFISYNPWDESTRVEDHFAGLGKLLKDTDADGVVLDTKGESSRRLQSMADSVKPGIIMYSEGMAVPANMPGIISGRVHNALFMPPVLNMNKYIKPDFSIFRVIDLAEDNIHRELSLAFFNGYGVEINMMRPGRPDWISEEFEFLGKTTRILRENTTAFNDRNWHPVFNLTHDNIYVNSFRDKAKTIFTVFSLIPEGFSSALININESDSLHYVSLLNHEEYNLIDSAGISYLPVQTASFSKSWLGTRKEGSIDCIAGFRKALQSILKDDSLFVAATTGDEIRVWVGNPSYSRKYKNYSISGNRISLRNSFPDYSGKIVIQLLAKGELLDENICSVLAGNAGLISIKSETLRDSVAPEGMCIIPAAEYECRIQRDSLSQEPFIPFPDYSYLRKMKMPQYFMDIYPVSNFQYFIFLKASGYKPADTINFLKHWGGERPPVEIQNHPVVYVSLEDARAYAKWAGKRLPNEIEWQYAAQGTDGRAFPWGNQMDSTKCNYSLNHTTPVYTYSSGRSPFGIVDLIGNVWQMTDDVYFNGSYYYNIIRGGSHYNPKGSIWYAIGGPVPVFHPEMMLMVSPAFDRSPTVGFRCIKDALQ